jgi:hypothetical protein
MATRRLWRLHLVSVRLLPTTMTGLFLNSPSLRDDDGSSKTNRQGSRAPTRSAASVPCGSRIMSTTFAASLKRLCDAVYPLWRAPYTCAELPEVHQ